MDEHDLPLMSLTFSSRERSQILIALWHDYLTQLQLRDRSRRNAIDQETDDSILLAVDAMQVDEALFDLVRKFGGDPNAQSFMPGMPPREI